MTTATPTTIRLAEFSYDIPVTVNFTNPTAYLRRRNDVSKIFAFRTQYSKWYVDRDNPPLTLMRKMEQAGCIVDLINIEESSYDLIRRRAHEQMARELDRAKKMQAESLKKADDKLHATEQEFASGVIGWDKLQKARHDHVKHREDSLTKLEQMVKDLEATAELFGIKPATNAFQSALRRVSGIRALGLQRAELYTDLADAVKGTQMGDAAADSEVPAPILADYAEEHGLAPDKVAALRENLAVAEQAETDATATATVTMTDANSEANQVARPLAKGVTRTGTLLTFRTDLPGLTYDKKVKQFTIEISMLGGNGAPLSIDLVSERTGNVSRFNRDSVQRDSENEVLWVDYLNAENICLRLMND